jgi:tetratricopeptide (TPR) repeat protein
MQLYSQGLVKFRTFDSLGARELLARAVAADPSYPFAHSALALAWQALGYDNETQGEAKRALDLAARLSREENLMLEARYYEASKNWPKAIDTYKTLFILFPDSLDYGIGLARVQSSSGKGKEALTTLVALARESAYAGADPDVDLAMADAAASLGDDKLRRDTADRAAAKADHLGRSCWWREPAPPSAGLSPISGITIMQMRLARKRGESMPMPGTATASRGLFTAQPRSLSIRATTLAPRSFIARRWRFSSKLAIRNRWEANLSTLA